MPTYAYRCTACSQEFEIFQKFTDAPLTGCPECGEAVRKVFQPVGIVFKGSGWYINDSRKPEPAAEKADGKVPEKGDKSDGKVAATADPANSKSTPSTTSETSSASTPAAAKAAAD